MKSRDTSGKNEDMIESYEIKLVKRILSVRTGVPKWARTFSISVSSLESMLVIFLVHADTTNYWNKDLGN